jgi:hypothetical protein
MIKRFYEMMANRAYRNNKVEIGHFWAKRYHSC